MKKTFKLLCMFVAVTVIGTAFTACNDDDDSTMSRLFRPILSDITTGLDANDVPYIRLEWDNYAGANRYIAKVVNTSGTDSATIMTDTTYCTFNNLSYDQDYNIYIYSMNTETGLESREYTTVATTPDYPTLLRTVSSANIIDTQVRILWNTDDNGELTDYDFLKLYRTKGDSLIVEYEVTEEDKQAGEYIFKNLEPKTEYRVEAWKGEDYKGKKVFTTAASENFEGAVVDLRGMEEDEIYKYLSTDVVDSIIGAHPDENVTLVFEGGKTYRMPTITLPATTGVITFTTGLSLAGNAQFAVSGNFTVAANSYVAGLNLNSIDFTDAPLEGKGRTSDSNYGSTYLFNIGNSGAALGSVNIKDCSIKYKRGVCRIQTAATIDSLNFNNCIIDSIAGYGLSNADNASAEIRNITIKNSTVSNIQVGLAATKGPNPNSVAIENCTFVYCITSGKYFIDFNGRSVANGIKLTNCLFGVSGSTPGNLAPMRAWRSDTSPQVLDLYFTSDFSWAVQNAETGTLYSTFDGKTISTDTKGTFKSPTTSDFTNINTTDFKSILPGDPRWY